MEAKGALVALTTSHFKPAKDYVGAIRRAYQDPSVAAVGGRIDPPAGLGGIAWAVYLMRYHRLLGVDAPRKTDDFAADNGTYRTAEIQKRISQSSRAGFWEHEYHREMKRDGLDLRYDPAIRVRQIAAFSPSDFARLRFEHGVLFGKNRAAGRSGAARLGLAFRTILLLPPLLLARAFRGVTREPRSLSGFAVSLPALLLFACAWSAGEAAGYCASEPLTNDVGKWNLKS